MSAPPIRDRITAFRRIRSGDLVENEKNWRRHPEGQRTAMTAVLSEIGMAGVLLAYHSERHDGALTLIDGHLRHDLNPDLVWPVAVLDVTDAEADTLLATYDPISAQAEADYEALQSLVQSVETDSLELQALMAATAAAAAPIVPDPAADADQKDMLDRCQHISTMSLTDLIAEANVYRTSARDIKRKLAGMWSDAIVLRLASPDCHAGRVD